MELIPSLTLCVSGVIGTIIGHLLFEMFTYSKEDKTGMNMCTTCEHCTAIDGDGLRVATESCPLEYNHYSYPVTCACYKPRKEEIEE